MNRNNFITIAAAKGYATAAFTLKWLRESGRDKKIAFTKSDLTEVCWAFSGNPLPTTKK